MEFADLNTQRFKLKILKPEFISIDYLNWFLDENTSKFIVNKNYTLDQLKEYCSEKLAASNCIFWGIFFGSIHIGNIKFEPIDFKECKSTMGVLIGNKEWQGKGVFGEVFHASFKELHKLGINRIYLGVDLNNQSALRSYLKAGFIITEVNSNNYTMLFQG